MNYRFFGTFPILVGIAFFVGEGCSSSDTTDSVHPAAPKAAMPADDLGRAVELKGPAKRVVIIGPGAVETLFAFGAGKQLVGRDEIAKVPKAALAASVVGDYRGPFPERVAPLRPDLVVVQGETWTKAAMDQWQRQCGAPTAALTAASLEGVAQDMEKLGAWTGHKAEANSVANQLRAASQPKQPKHSIFVEVGRSPLWTAGKGTLVGEVVNRAFNNAAEKDFGLVGYKPFGLESLYAKQPDAYLVTDTRAKAQVLAELRRTADLSKLRCIREGKVVVIDGDLVLRPGPRLADGIAELKAAAQELSK